MEFKINNIDCIEGMKLIPNDYINTIITSPPYNKKGLYGRKSVGNQVWKKFNIDYGDYGDDMNEDDYIKWQVKLLNECFRVLKPDGSMFYNHKVRRFKNISYNPYDIVRLSDFNLYQIIIWNRKSSPNLRNDILTPTTEYIFWLSKIKPKVFKNSIPKEYRSEVWNIPPIKQKDHPAPFHPLIPELCINLTTEENDIVMDPFMGIGTTFHKCVELNRKCIGFEIDEKYLNKTNN